MPDPDYADDPPLPLVDGDLPVTEQANTTDSGKTDYEWPGELGTGAIDALVTGAAGPPPIATAGQQTLTELEQIARLKGRIVHDTSLVLADLTEIAELRPASHAMVATIKQRYAEALGLSEREL